MKQLLAASLLFTTIAGAADHDPFAGTWRYRANRSHYAATYKIYAVGDRNFQAENGIGRGPTLPVNGSPRESPQGGTVSLKRIHNRTYVYTLKRASLYKRTITLDGDKMTWAEDQEMDTGKHELSESYWQRVGHGTGLAGEWHMTGHNDPAEKTNINTVRAIPGGLRFGSSDQKQEQDVIFDEKEHSAETPDGVKGIFYIAKRLNAHSYQVVTRRNGEVLNTVTCALSDDANTSTCTYVDNHGQQNIYVQERASQ